jgi:hypothetical protein
MALTWPTNTATPPPGWNRMTDVDGTTPMGWFTRPHNGMRIVARAYPTWDDAPWDIPADARTPMTAEELDYDDMDIYLHTVFDMAHRGYLFPDVPPENGPATHPFVNLDFVGGWRPAIPHDVEYNTMLERTLAGLKPASDLVDTNRTTGSRPRRDRWMASAREAGMTAIPYDDRYSDRLWVAPARLGERVDQQALTSAWQALTDADPNRHRRKIVQAVVNEALPSAFAIDLHEPPTEQPGGRMLASWWDESSDEGLVALGAVLGYPPASTYSLLVEGFGPLRLPKVP